MALRIMGLPSDPEAEKLFAEEGHRVLWARPIGRYGYAVDIRGGREGHFRARATRLDVLEGKKDPTRTNDFELLEGSLDAAIERLRDFRKFLG